MRHIGWGRALIALGLIGISASATPQARRPLTALASLQKGLWEIREISNPGARAAFCVSDPNILMQVQHRTEPCSRLVISSSVTSATVHYTCPAGGFGRTSIRVESPRLALIETQGIRGGTPFEYRAEARRKSSCPRPKRR